MSSGPSDDRACGGCGVKKRVATPWFAVDGARSVNSKDEVATPERKETDRPLSKEQRRTTLAPHDRDGGEARRYAARRPFQGYAGIGWRARAVMAPPNSSRAGRCGTFLGAAARRRRLPHAMGNPLRRRPRNRATARGKNSWCSIDNRSTTHVAPPGREGGKKSCAATTRPAGRSRPCCCRTASKATPARGRQPTHRWGRTRRSSRCTRNRLRPPPRSG